MWLYIPLFNIIEISRCFSKVDIYLCFDLLSLQNSFEPVAKFYIPLKINFSTMPAYIAEVTPLFPVYMYGSPSPSLSLSHSLTHFLYLLRITPGLTKQLW